MIYCVNKEMSPREAEDELNEIKFKARVPRFDWI